MCGRHCGQRGVNSPPTPIYQPTSPKQTDRQGSCPNRPVYLATAAERTGQWLFTLLPSPTVTHSHAHKPWQGISLQSCLGDAPSTPESEGSQKLLSETRKCPCSGLCGGGGWGLKWPVGPVSNASQSPLCEEQKLSALKLGNLVTLGRLEHHHLKSLPGNVCSGWTWLLVGTLGASRAPCQAPWTAPHRCTHTPASGEADLLDWPPDRCLLLCVYCLRPPTATLISA